MRKLRLFRRSPRIVTVPVWRGGILTMPEPAWCTGEHSSHAEHPVDFRHCGVAVPLVVTVGGRQFEILSVSVIHDPFSSGDVLPQASVGLGADDFRRFTRSELHDFADGLVRHADYMRTFADEVEELRAALGSEDEL